MSRTKGTPKTGGRQAGTPNKVTGSTKGFIKELLDENREQIRKDIKKLAPKDRLAVLARFMQFVVPNEQEPQEPIEFKMVVVGDCHKPFPSSEDEVDP